MNRTNGTPIPPVAVADEVELYARDNGRTATLHFYPTLLQGTGVLRGTWVVHFSLRVDDRAMVAWKEGRAEEPPVERVWLHEKNPDADKIIPRTGGLREQPYRALNLEALGAAGVREFLEKGNTWGRGEFKTFEEQLKATREHNETLRVTTRENARQDAIKKAGEKRRHWFKIPFLGVLENIGRRKQSVE